MEELLKNILSASGVSGYEKEISRIMSVELGKTCDQVQIDNFGNVIARKGQGRKKIMLAAHMDEIGLLVKYVSPDGFIGFIKIGGIDDRILPGQRVVIKGREADVRGVIGQRPIHLQKEEERKKPVKYEEMFIDIGCRSKEEALKKIAPGDPVVFEPNCGRLNDNLFYGKAVDDRVGCFALLKIMEKVNAPAEVYAVATAQEEVGLKGARTSAFKVDPDFAIVIDTTTAGDIPQVKERESSLKLGAGVAITIVEAGGRGIIVSEKVKDLLIGTAEKNKIKYQIDVLEGGMTDGAMIHMSRAGVPTGVLAIPARYVHSPTGVFDITDLDSAVNLAVKVIEAVAKE